MTCPHTSHQTEALRLKWTFRLTLERPPHTNKGNNTWHDWFALRTTHTDQYRTLPKNFPGRMSTTQKKYFSFQCHACLINRFFPLHLWLQSNKSTDWLIAILFQTWINQAVSHSVSLQVFRRAWKASHLKNLKSLHPTHWMQILLLQDHQFEEIFEDLLRTLWMKSLACHSHVKEFQKLLFVV